MLSEEQDSKNSLSPPMCAPLATMPLLDTIILILIFIVLILIIPPPLPIAQVIGGIGLGLAICKR